MMPAWEDVTLQEVAAEITVGHVGPMVDQYVDIGVPFLRSLNVEPFRINTKDLKHISKDFHARLRKSALKPGDVIIVRTGKPGSCAVIPNWLIEANCSDVVVVRAGPNVRPAYISYVVNFSAVHHIGAYTVGAVQQHFNVGSARQIRFRLPSIAEQDRILAVLGSLDEKIDLNRRMNETLEAMARAIFKDWFVDFGPTRAKAEGSAPYLAPEIWSLFPDELDDNDRPSRWGDKPLSAVIDLTGGGTPKTSVAEYWGGPIPWFSVADAPNPSDVFVLKTEKSITSTGLENSSTRILPLGATIITARGTVGKLAMVGTQMAMNQSCYAVIGKAGWPKSFIYFFLKTTIQSLQANTHGSVFDTITRQTFDAVSACCPTPKVAEAFERSVDSILGRIRTNLQENETLTTIRDLLLPKLMSGEIRLREAEKIVEAAA